MGYTAGGHSAGRSGRREAAHCPGLALPPYGVLGICQRPTPLSGKDELLTMMGTEITEAIPCKGNARQSPDLGCGSCQQLFPEVPPKCRSIRPRELLSFSLGRERNLINQQASKSNNRGVQSAHGTLDSFETGKIRWQPSHPTSDHTVQDLAPRPERLPRAGPPSEL